MSLEQPEFRFCLLCAGTLEMRPAGDARTEHPTCAKCGFVLWQNPKPCVEALITRGHGSDTEILLGRHSPGAHAGLWDTPGNFLNAGDHLEEALIRECRREMDVEVEVGELLGAFEDIFLGGPIIALVYLCRIAAGVPRPADIIEEVAWFPVLEPPSIAYPSIDAAICVLGGRVHT